MAGSTCICLRYQLLARPICLLMVDSDPERLALVRGAMRRRADMMLTAGSIEEARQSLRQFALPIDWVLIDLGTNGDGGLAFAVEVRNGNSEIGILLTADAAFASDFPILTKPYFSHDLWAALTR